MRLPRDLSGHRLAALLNRFGYEPIRQTGSHIRLVSTRQGAEHRITIPAHRAVSVGTLSAILTEVAEYLQVDKGDLAEELFG